MKKEGKDMYEKNNQEAFLSLKIRFRLGRTH